MMPEPTGIAALRLGPRDRGIEIGNQLRIRLAVDERQQLGHFRDLGEVLALAEIVVGRHRERAELGKAPRHVLDVLVQPENLHGDQDHRRVLRVRRLGEIDGHLAVRHLGLCLSHRQAGGVRRHHLGAHGTGGQRIAGGGRGRGRHEPTARHRRGLGQAHDIGGKVALHSHHGLQFGKGTDRARREGLSCARKL